jgi:hypothetical protein
MPVIVRPELAGEIRPRTLGYIHDLGLAVAFADRMPGQGSAVT